MPQVIIPAGISAGIAGGAAAIAGKSVLYYAGYAFFSTLVVGGISTALNKPKKLNTLGQVSQTGGQTVSARSAADTVKLIYGETRVGGTIVHLETTGNDKLLHMVVVLAGHECDSIGDVYTGARTIDSSPIKQGSYSGIPITFAPYTEDGQARVELQRGGASSANFASIFEDWETCFEISSTSDNDGIYRRVITGRENDISGTTVRAERIDGGTATSETSATTDIDIRYIWVTKYLGTSTQTADADLIAASDDWTSTDRLRGLCYVYIRAGWNSQIFPQGIENISAVVKGRKVYDPRGPSTAWSDNAALCCADYLTDATYGYGVDYTSEIDEASLIAAANECEETVDKTVGTEDRYTCNGLLDTGVSVDTNLGQLLSSMGGKAVFTSGTWHLVAAAWSTPSVTLDEDDIIDTVNVQTRIPRRELFNAVKGLFVWPQNDYQPSDFAAQVSATYATEDGATLFRDMDLPFTNSPTMAQRLARIELLKIRQQISVRLRCKLTALRLRPCDVVQLTNTRLGWSAKNFEVVDWSLTLDERELGVDLGLRETDSTIFDWNTGLEQAQDPASDTNLPDPWSLDAPENLGATSGTTQLFEQADGTIVTRIEVLWTHPNSAAVAHYEVSYARVDSWYSDAIAYTPAFTISPVKDGDSYNIRVRAVNHFGIKSAYTALTSAHVVVGKTAAPPDVTSFLVARQPDGTREFSWTLSSPPADLAGFQIRYTLGTGGTWTTMADLHTGLLKATPYETNLLAAGTYTVGIKAVDTTGNYSASAKIIESTLGDPRLSNAILNVDFTALGFPGTKTDCGWDAINRALVPGSDDTWSSLPGSDWTDWDAWNDDIVSSMVYEHTTIDLTAVTSFKVLASVTIDSGAVTIEEQHSDDDVTYSSWAATGAQISGRYVKIRITVTSPHIDGITQAGAIIDAETIFETLNDVATSTMTGSTGDRRLPITKSYSSIWIVNLALQNVGAGWTWEIIDKNATSGPRIKIYNSSGTLADATIDAEIKGV